ncbi:MAG: hypothetical protein ACRECF_04895 [Methyloceanibacter sp.]
MRFPWTIALVFMLASPMAYAGGEPIDHPTQTERREAPPAPQSLVIVACRVVDLTGLPGRHDPAMAARDWRDLDLYINPKSLEYECKREQVDLEDAVAANYPRKPFHIAGVGDIWPHEDHPQAPVTGSLYAEPLAPNFGGPTQCVRAGVVQSQKWNEENRGYAVVAVGCPSPIGIDSDGDGEPDIHTSGPLKGQYVVKQWVLPGCPTYLPGTKNPRLCT